MVLKGVGADDATKTALKNAAAREAVGKAGAINAAVYAAKILSLSNNEINTRLTNWLSSQTNEVPLTPKMKND